MAETGIEDFASDPEKGCASSLVPAIVFAVVLIALIGLISWYCSPPPALDSNHSENTNR
jgi:hypothetical protein